MGKVPQSSKAEEKLRSGDYGEMEKGDFLTNHSRNLSALTPDYIQIEYIKVQHSENFKY